MENDNFGTTRPEIDNTNSLTQTNKDLRLDFRGNALDYFKVWIVNTLLSIITLGLYSPWAKVRNNQYLYLNSYFGQNNFEYTANPVRILIGRLVVVGFYAAFIITGEILGLRTVSMIILFMFLLLMPWLFRQSIAFRQRYTRFQGINFKFHASTGEFYIFFIKHLFLMIITFGLIFPYTHSKYKELVLCNTSYGTSLFEYESKAGDFYIVYLIKHPIILFLFSAVFTFVWLIFAIGTTVGADTHKIYAMVSGVYFLIIINTLLSKGLLDGWLGNIVYNNTCLDNYKMQNNWSAFKLAWIYVSNFFIVVFTAGLMHPWAKVRIIKYKLENIGFENFNFHKFIAEKNRDEKAFGEESADFFDIDVGL